MGGKHSPFFVEWWKSADVRWLSRLKAGPKDSFALLHIDTLVDNTVNHYLFSFMDRFLGYKQIKMVSENHIRDQVGNIYYRVMLFGLKNMVATYQRAMVTLFHDMMHNEIEVYVDDMTAKSQEKETTL